MRFGEGRDRFMSSTSTILDLLASLRRHDITLWVENGRLRYDAPRDALTPELRARLAAHRDELIAFFEAADAGRAGQPAITRRAEPDAPAPLSFAQQRLWLLDQLAPGSPTYVMAASVRLSGPLDAGALEQSLNELVRRHEVLRTNLALLDEHPVQQIGLPWTLRLGQDDLAALPMAERDQAARRRIAELCRQPFDLATGRLLRAHLLRLAPSEHILLLTMHHIVADGWSMRVLIRELATLYPAMRAGVTPDLPDLPVQYADYAHWQRAWLQGEKLDRLLAYWTGLLSGDLPVLALPVDYPRPAQRRHRGAAQPVELPPALVAGIDRLAQRAGCTPFMVLLAAFGALLGRYSGQSRVLIGSPIANRTQVEIEGLIGCFINTLVLPLDLDGSPRFAALLQQVRETMLGALAHQDLPFERLVEQLQPERDPGQTPLFQVLFDLQDAPASALLFDDLRLELLDLDPGIAKFDLALSLHRDGERLGGTLRYNTDLFAPATAARMASHFIALLAQLVEQPEQRISEAELLTSDERRELLETRNATAVSFPHELCFHTLVEAQVDRTPDALAALGEPGLSYAELDRRANQLAHLLQSYGIGPEVPVALCADLGPDLLVGLLGILKAGGAYVPLDPDYPPERMGLVLEDTHAPVLVTQQALLPRLPAHQTRIVSLDGDAETLARQPQHRLHSPVAPRNLAYVLYTSGSTGRPKGVMIEHRSLVNYLHWVNTTLVGPALQRIPAITKLSFDASLKQLLAPLLRGDAVWFLPGDVARQPQRLAEELSRHPNVGLNCVPALWRGMLDPILSGHVLFPEGAPFSLLLGGEQLADDLIAQTFAALPNAQLWNVYGPTETTANASAGLVRSDGPATLGAPIANTQLYVLSPELRPQPVGVPGELYIGGVGLARGYFGRPDLTAERFIPNPFGAGGQNQEPDNNSGDTSNAKAKTHHSRLYKTGDLVRYRIDGTLEFLGRVDSQIKLRGFRIELGEIEAVLARHPLLRQAVVVLHQAAAGEGRLVGYVVPDQPGTANPAELKEWLRARLPEYMVPASIVELERLPLLHNGKLDRRALPVPAFHSTDARDYTAPRTPVETALAEMWAELLGLARVGVHDSFFDLGGHSLLATQVLARVRKLYGVTPSLQVLFEQPTVAKLAEAVEAELRTQGEQPAAPAAPRIARRDSRARRLASQIDQISDTQARRLLGEKKSLHSGEHSDD
ncbi:MAG: hypothetical protein OHK0022_06420 [Roseiflexaceae bacterium]